MHTSSVLSSADFSYCRVTDAAPLDFATFMPQYSPLDRVAVVSPCLEDGILSAGYALLAITTAFYDYHRASGRSFFDYPHHFSLIGASTDDRIATHSGLLALKHRDVGAPWSNLDVWPDSQWGTCPPTVSAMLDNVCSRQISRVFWPAQFRPRIDEPVLPAYVPRLLSSRLRNVYYYDSSVPSLAIYASQQVEDMVAKSVAHLPRPDRHQRATCRATTVGPLPWIQTYRQITVASFLHINKTCFASA